MAASFTLVLAFVVGIALAVVVHEGAHWLSARALGQSARLGWTKTGPHVDAEMPPGWRAATFFAAGPLANLGAFALLIAARVDAASGLTLLFVSGPQLLSGVFNLVPWPAHTDGARLLAQWRHRTHPVPTTSDRARA